MHGRLNIDPPSLYLFPSFSVWKSVGVGYVDLCMYVQQYDFSPTM